MGEVARARDHHGAELVAVGEITKGYDELLLVNQQLENPYPWREVASAQEAAKKLGATSTLPPSRSCATAPRSPSSAPKRRPDDASTTPSPPPPAPRS